MFLLHWKNLCDCGRTFSLVSPMCLKVNSSDLKRKCSIYIFFYNNYQVGVQTDAFEQIQQYTVFPQEAY